MKLESYGPDCYYFTYDIRMLVISIIRIRNSLDKYLPEFLHIILPLLLLITTPLMSSQSVHFRVHVIGKLWTGLVLLHI